MVCKLLKFKIFHWFVGNDFLYTKQFFLFSITIKVGAKAEIYHDYPKLLDARKSDFVASKQQMHKPDCASTRFDQSPFYVIRSLESQIT